MRVFVPAVLALGLAAGCGEVAPTQPIKVVIVTMYQDVSQIATPGSGEAAAWYAAGYNRPIEVPGAYAPAYADATGERLLVVTGPGESNAATSIMALGFSPRFDLRQAYFLTAGTAGVNPNQGTIGSAAWAGYLVDSGLAAEIDPRQLPLSYEYPFFRVGCIDPPFCTDGFTWGTEYYQLNPTLRAAAYALTREVVLADNDAAAEIRALYPQPAARALPSVLLGDSVTNNTFFHGSLLSNYNAWWMTNWTNGAGTYVMAESEDNATATALQRLDAAGRVQFSRYMVLRAGSNFDQEHPGQSAVESLASQSQPLPQQAEQVSLENLYRVGSVVADAIVADWATWRNGPPTQP